jgi:hypothetical protein
MSKPAWGNVSRAGVHPGLLAFLLSGGSPASSTLTDVH